MSLFDWNRTYLSYLRERAEKTPERILLTEVDGRELNYAESYRESLQWASALRKLGVEPGDCTASMLVNCIDGHLAWLGAAWIGALDVPLSVQLRGPTLSYMLNNCKAKVLVTSVDLLPRLAEIAHELASLRIVVVSTFIQGDITPVANGITVVSRDDLFASAARPQNFKVPQLHDAACLLYTSGTTGPSKGTIVPWGQLNASMCGSDLSVFDETAAFYYTGASNHIPARCTPGVLAALGGRFVLRPSFKTGAYWSDIDRYDCNWGLLIGAMSHYLLSLPESQDDAKHALRYCSVSPLPPDIAAFCKRFGIKISSGYSSTEISGPIVVPGWVTKGDPTSCGRLRQGWPFYQVRIVDEFDREVSVGQTGELIVRTDAPWTLNRGYLGQPEATLSALRNGWFHTGDAFRCDAEGNYFFIDRMKDAIRKSGENISSFEVEAIANSHPAVVESAAVAVPAETTEDEIKLFVVRKLGADVTPAELITFMAARMPRFMVPRFLEFIDELPRTQTLRVKKIELRSRLGGDVWDRVAAGVKI